MYITIAANGVALLLTLLIPVAVALVTKKVTRPAIKAIITMILAAVVVLVNHGRQDDGSSIISAQMAFDWVITTAVAVASYVGFYEPVVDINAKAAPEHGI